MEIESKKVLKEKRNNIRKLQINIINQRSKPVI